MAHCRVSPAHASTFRFNPLSGRCYGPGKMGIGLFSPLLDTKGNSVRGVKTCEAMSRDLGLHVLGAGTQPKLGQLRPEFSGG